MRAGSDHIRLVAPTCAPRPSCALGPIRRASAMSARRIRLIYPSRAVTLLMAVASVNHPSATPALLIPFGVLKADLLRRPCSAASACVSHGVPAAFLSPPADSGELLPVPQLVFFAGDLGSSGAAGSATSAHPTDVHGSVLCVRPEPLCPVPCCHLGHRHRLRRLCFSVAVAAVGVAVLALCSRVCSYCALGQKW